MTGLLGTIISIIFSRTSSNVSKVMSISRNKCTGLSSRSKLLNLLISNYLKPYFNTICKGISNKLVFKRLIRVQIMADNQWIFMSLVSRNRINKVCKNRSWKL